MKVKLLHDVFNIDKENFENFENEVLKKTKLPIVELVHKRKVVNSKNFHKIPSSETIHANIPMRGGFVFTTAAILIGITAASGGVAVGMQAVDTADKMAETDRQEKEFNELIARENELLEQKEADWKVLSGELEGVIDAQRDALAAREMQEDELAQRREEELARIQREIDKLLNDNTAFRDRKDLMMKFGIAILLCIFGGVVCLFAVTGSFEPGN